LPDTQENDSPHYLSFLIVSKRKVLSHHIILALNHEENLRNIFSRRSRNDGHQNRLQNLGRKIKTRDMNKKYVNRIAATKKNYIHKKGSQKILSILGYTLIILTL
jgi:hypothetical protein